ncbi:hypothetical protein D2Q93_10515 [Alicyclobacillaceae bacterium I2511]|nr:hypothetical protein D2Q93_10515 [Alicyclobacillaceae bacterium I2511]
MADLSFSIHAQWSGTGKQGEGTVYLDGQDLIYSAPSSMGGKGVGTSPEELLLSAVTACYSGTLFRLLVKSGLPVEDLTIETEGTVTGFPLNAVFSKVRVHPTIHGGDAEHFEAYQVLTKTARDRCFIGKTIMGNVAYEVGNVTILEPAAVVSQ